MTDSKMPWVKLYTEALDDPKLGRLPDSLKWRFVQFVMLAGECDAEGYLISGSEPMTVQDLAWRLRIDEKQLEEDTAALSLAGLIVNDDGAWLIVNFSKRQ